MKWYKKLHRSIKEFWDKEVRPTVEPVLRIVFQGKLAKEIERAKR